MLLTDEAYTPALIRALGIRSNDRQEEFAAQLGVSHKSVNHWENGHAIPSPMALKLIQDLRCRVATLSNSDRD